MTYWLDEKVEDIVVKSPAQIEEDRLKTRKLLMYDLKNFLKSVQNREREGRVLAEEFCNKWQGYKKEFGVKEVERIITNGEHHHVYR